MATLNVSLTSELNTLIREKVASGMYHSSSEVVRAALRLFQQHDEYRELRLARLRAQISTGIHQLDTGDSLEFSSGKELMSHIRAQGSSHLENQKVDRE